EYNKEKKDKNGFGEWLRDMRGSLELTLEDLAELAGVSDSQVIDVELGRRNPSRDTAKWLVSAVGLSGQPLREVLDYFVPLPAVQVLIDDEEVLTSVGQVLREKRLARGLTRGTVAERVGVAIRTVSGVEAGRRRPSAEVAVRWIEAL